MENTHQDNTSFGYRTVTEQEKTGLVKEVFSSVSSKYDIMNDTMSFGIHRVWKDALVDWMAPQVKTSCLDLAGGTGDIAKRIIKRNEVVDVHVVHLT
ncbi:MAG: bifunctional demethylmenaquinone methyltransferase/2-methoxy-6-polyprenyl-1,4-benzoquinol methylase UbiE, partial [Rhodobacteraceae bacterium]|nr:bifunctional demethylmenaquinone methyltransferase/2-methoxy-6-polyprenyl-1,4-benzoquinol methylase UbiE [Paracoccaceae bacterium]